MFDTNFLIEFHNLKKNILTHSGFINKNELYEELEKIRSKNPYIFNIETTNFCEFKCGFCPRSTLMTRKLETLEMNVFRKIIQEIEPLTKKDIERWKLFCVDTYNISENDMSENAFYLYVSALNITLHGFGNPLLDSQLRERIRLLSEKNIGTYFSTNPSTMKTEKVLDLVKSGLNYIKFSVDGIKQNVRDKRDLFYDYYSKILEILNEIQKNNYNTKVVITMIDLRRENQQEEWRLLQKYFEGANIFLYLKSQDQTWYENKEKNAASGKSICWSEFCQFPWYALAIKSNGDVAMCSEDYNNSIIFGNVQDKSLYDIWNGGKYDNFRKEHIDNSCLYCINNCDMNMIGQYL